MADIPKAAWRWNFGPRLLIGLEAIGLFLVERRIPLRRAPALGFSRLKADAGMAFAGLLAQSFIVNPAAKAAACESGGARGGIVRRLPRVLRFPAAVVLMDFTLYLWHVLLHRVPLLWRFHAAHHADPHLDSFTAFRFHPGELILSIPWRMAQIRLIGVDRATLAAWRGFLAVSVLFHHSNLRLPSGLERILGWFVATPRLHGIHHGNRSEQDLANFTSGLAIWDFLGGTRRDAPDQSELVIGVPGLPRGDAAGFQEALAYPFLSGSGRLP